ncbi:LysR family transcriptional regulator [Chitinimonas sp. BJB300]|uniref:LysR family transcriptional regulator n=1 Tax=Chitinimonas sp. BJB300 TaxID=1559339 RepID=UPI000C0FBA5C|nr:LysR family transcriptional regulator [Chitinimonas sp. BJB300]PHV13209.1 hypothetical protein CSQ89_01450 [Chitinimonas sp. BJB300]TSJ89600.1 LysR family transcriptional regulator [Chitinimonas sp. BJB300]
METITPRFQWSMTFLAVIEQGGFSAAANHLGHSKAHVSKQISQLERALGASLLHRSTRRMVLTESGKHYLVYCQQLRDTLDEASRAVGNLHKHIEGLIRLTAPTNLGVNFVGDLLVAFRARYPQTQIELDLSQQMRDLIGEQYSLAIRTGQPQDERLIARPLGIVQEWIVAAPALTDRLGYPQTPQALLERPCVINSHYIDGAKWLFMQADHNECIEIPRHFCVNNYAALRHLALAGAGYVKVPDYLVARDIQLGRLQPVLTTYTLPHTPLYLVYPSLRPQPAKVRALIDFICEWFDQHLPTNKSNSV